MSEQEAWVYLGGPILLLAYIVLKPYYRLFEAKRTWRKSLDRTDVLILGIQTTGEDSSAEILELAAIDTTGALRFHGFFLPQGNIPREASGQHGLSLEELKRRNARPWREIHAEAFGLLKGAKRLIAYEQPYVRRLLKQTAGRYGLPIPGKEWVNVREGYRVLRPYGRNRLTDALRREEVNAKEQARRTIFECHCVLEVMRVVMRTYG